MARQRFRRRSLAEARAQTEAVLSGAPVGELAPKPRRNVRHIESQHGRALIKWRDSAKGRRPELEWLHHIPNNFVVDSAKIAGMWKAEGLTKGVLDYFLPVHRFNAVLYPGRVVPSNASGMYVELKAPGLENHARGGMTEKQEQFATFVHNQGYLVCLCYHWHQAREAIEAYLDGKPIPHLWSPPE